MAQMPQVSKPSFLHKATVNRSQSGGSCVPLDGIWGIHHGTGIIQGSKPPDCHVEVPGRPLAFGSCLVTPKAYKYFRRHVDPLKKAKWLWVATNGTILG